ncbi:ATP-dependent Clp protease proteolytic subunit [Cardinium endosymbiont of Oedothorax gibbosus]|uniref:ATP-dependent Clp protease proteolytic subunit n=1 Tax=Cardinium endosymbiont of Oedothorax gibbosus TaxID=931101 RepID=UPI00202561B4|nr:ATP-dependent Clp protease proteolytic subunit [Cardinium endosymbiont of Oedothorax gibbosus]
MQKKASDVDHSNAASKAKLKSDLEAENALNRARLEKQLSTIIAQIEQLRLKKELQRLNKEIEDDNAREAHDKAMLLLNMEREKVTIELELAKARFMKQMEQYDTQLITLDKKIQLEKGQTQLLQETSHRLQAEMGALQAKIARDNYIQKKPIYLKDPLIKRSNTLVLSDRYIQLNGSITPWKANYIVDQIHYFNNKNSQYPIFLIIGYSPGGWVSAGWNILQAIEHSKAPVYVVVKAFAASMAALITTLATKSYAYPNAEILHHHPGIKNFFGRLNLRETKEMYEDLKETWNRLGGRVARKMGISLAAFEKKLYEKSMYGDWMEYGDNAKKLKWVDYVISGIQHSAVSSLPDPTDYTFEQFIKQYGFGEAKGKEPSEEWYCHALAPHDFDYSYRPTNRKSQIMGKQ